MDAGKLVDSSFQVIASVGDKPITQRFEAGFVDRPDVAAARPPSRIFVAGPDGVIEEVRPSPAHSEPAEFQALREKWVAEQLPRFERDFVGRLVAIAGLLIVLASACFMDEFGKAGSYVTWSFGLLLVLAGRIMIFRAGYEPAQRTQDTVEATASVVEKVAQWLW